MFAVAGAPSTRRNWARNLKAFLAKLPKGKAPKAAADLTIKGGDFTEIQPRQQAIVFQAFPGPGLHADDYLVSEVADELFSGMSSRLFERVREEKSLAYFVRSSRIVGLREAMAFYFYAGTSPATLRRGAPRKSTSEIKRVPRGRGDRRGIEPLRRSASKAGKRMGMQTNSSRAMAAALDNAVYQQPVNDWRTYDARIDAITLADIQAFARKYFVSGQRVQLVVKP